MIAPCSSSVTHYFINTKICIRRLVVVTRVIILTIRVGRVFAAVLARLQALEAKLEAMGGGYESGYAKGFAEGFAAGRAAD